jgi:hypothetical protein
LKKKKKKKKKNKENIGSSKAKLSKDLKQRTMEHLNLREVKYEGSKLCSIFSSLTYFRCSQG